MTKLLLAMTFAAIALSSPNAIAQGYYTAWLGAAPETAKTEPAHFVIAGVGEKLKDLMVDAAFSQALHWIEIEPEKPVVLLIYNELGQREMERKFKIWGVKRFAFRDSSLTATAIASETRFFPAVRSFEVYTHGARDGYAMLGYANDEYLALGDSHLRAMTSRFDNQAFARFYGCNVGYKLAPWLANLWGIPVGGALTSTDLQHLHANGNFFAYNDDTKPAGPWADSNALSFSVPRKCSTGGCLRMKPDPHPYDGVHGSYAGGLGFYKFFCGSMSDDACAKRIALTLPSWLGLRVLKPGDSPASYKETLADFLCPIHATRPIRAECLAHLAEIEAGRALDYSPFFGTELDCDFKACYPTDAVYSKGSTFAREYRAYLKGIVILKTAVAVDR